MNAIDADEIAHQRARFCRFEAQLRDLAPGGIRYFREDRYGRLEEDATPAMRASILAGMAEASAYIAVLESRDR